MPLGSRKVKSDRDLLAVNSGNFFLYHLEHLEREIISVLLGILIENEMDALVQQRSASRVYGYVWVCQQNRELGKVHSGDLDSEVTF